MLEGLLCEALTAVGVPAVVYQAECFRRGAESCVFEISSAFVGHHWSGERVA
jgi:predicted hydrocarbon binding protein